MKSFILFTLVIAISLAAISSFPLEDDEEKRVKPLNLVLCNVLQI